MVKKETEITNIFIMKDLKKYLLATTILASSLFGGQKIAAQNKQDQKKNWIDLLMPEKVSAHYGRQFLTGPSFSRGHHIIDFSTRHPIMEDHTAINTVIDEYIKENTEQTSSKNSALTQLSAKDEVTKNVQKLITYKNNPHNYILESVSEGGDTESEYSLYKKNKHSYRRNRLTIEFQNNIALLGEKKDVEINLSYGLYEDETDKLAYFVAPHLHKNNLFGFNKLSAGLTVGIVSSQKNTLTQPPYTFSQTKNRNYGVYAAFQAQYHTNNVYFLANITPYSASAGVGMTISEVGEAISDHIKQNEWGTKSKNVGRFLAPKNISFTFACQHWNGNFFNQTGENLYGLQNHTPLSHEEVYTNYIQYLETKLADLEAKQHAYQVTASQPQLNEEYAALNKSIEKVDQRLDQAQKKGTDGISIVNKEYVAEGDTIYSYNLFDKNRIYYNQTRNFGVLMRHDLYRFGKNDRHQIELLSGIFRNSYYNMSGIVGVGYNSDQIFNIEGLNATLNLAVTSGYLEDEVPDALEIKKYKKDGKEYAYTGMASVNVGYTFKNGLTATAIATPTFITVAAGVNLQQVDFNQMGQGIKKLAFWNWNKDDTLNKESNVSASSVTTTTESHIKLTQ